MKDASFPHPAAPRTEFGLERTECACSACTVNCHHIPGYLIPADLERIRQHLAADQELLDWAKQHLLASPGALVLQGGKTFRIPTLVPTRQASGVCLFLTPEGRCAIHAAAPFGCAYFDAHQPAAEADQRSQRGLRAVLEAWQQHAPYAQVWLTLHEAGLDAPAPELCRQQLRQALAQEQASVHSPQPEQKS